MDCSGLMWLAPENKHGVINVTDLKNWIPYVFKFSSFNPKKSYVDSGILSVDDKNRIS